MTAKHVMILAGEASGDAHAAEFVEVLKQREPALRISGMGSREMQAAGVDVFYDSAKIAVMGLVEVLKHWGEIKHAMARVREQLKATRPDLLVLVDYPEFNLKMAASARELGIPVLFYISPQLWAWRPKRIHKIGRLIDHMAVLFEFEKKYYQDANIPVTFVGHPLVDKVKISRSVEATRAALEIPDGSRVIGLLPGSRRSEVSRLLPVMLSAARQMSARDPELSFLLPVAATLDRDEIESTVSASGVKVHITEDDVYDVIASCKAVVTCSGTVTLETALLEVPMCIAYRMSAVSHAILSRLITIPYIGLVNIVAQKAVVREFIQREATAENIAEELFRILEDRTYRARMYAGLRQVRYNLGSGKGSANMAELVLSLLAKND